MAIHGYRVVTSQGKTVGHVAGESEASLVVECGSWPRKMWRALPRQFVSVDEEKSCVLIQVSKEMLAMSPKLKQGVPVDDQAVASWWGVDQRAVIWWHDTPDGRELKIAAEGSEWLVLVEGDDREYRGRDLRLVLAHAVDANATAPWLVALADQVEAAASGLPT